MSATGRDAVDRDARRTPGGLPGWTGPRLTQADEVRLARRVEAGDPDARETLVTANLYVVLAVAHASPAYGQPLADRVQEGTLGLIRAVDRFDWRRGVRLSTYATWWIRQAILRFVAEQSRPVRVPAHVVARAGLVSLVDRQLTQGLRRAPTVAEIAREAGLPVVDVELVRTLAVTPASIDGTAPGDRDVALIELLADASQVDLDERAEAGLRRRRLLALLRRLAPEERRLIGRRYGVGGRTATLDELASEMGVTRDQVRGLELRILRRLERLASEAGRG